MKKAFALVVVVLLSACGATIPVYYQGGVRWSAPMVAPLENGVVVVTATIAGQGPYLLLLDPHAEASGIDFEVASTLNLYATKSDQYLAENDTKQVMTTFEVPSLQAGDLSLKNFTIRGFRAGALTFAGHRIHAYLGADLLSRSIVVDIDRDRGWVKLALVGNEEPFGPAQVVSGRLHNRAVRVPAHVPGVPALDVMVDIAAATTALWPALLKKANLALAPSEEIVVDETGTATRLKGRAKAPWLRLGDRPGVEAKDVDIIPFDDRRNHEVYVDGLVGQNLLARYHVRLDQDQARVFLAARASDLGQDIDARVQRFGAPFSTCPDPGCLKLLFTPGNAPKPATVTAEATAAEPAPANDETTANTAPAVSLATRPHQLVLLRDARTKSRPFAVYAQALDEAGKPLAAPLLRITLDGQVMQKAIPIGQDDADYGGARAFRVVDLSPLAPACEASVCISRIRL